MHTSLIPRSRPHAVRLFCHTGSIGKLGGDLGMRLTHTARVCLMPRLIPSCQCVRPSSLPSSHSRTPMKRWSYVQECVGKERYHGATNYKAPQRPPVSKSIATPASKNNPCSREKTESKVLQPLKESHNTETAEAVKPKLSRRYAHSSLSYCRSHTWIKTLSCSPTSV